VDIDFYIRVLTEKKFCSIHRPLVNIGLHEEQVTRSSFGIPAVEIPENFYLLEKMGAEQLKNIVVFDAWWRLIRNFRITNEKAIRSAGFNGEIPTPIKKMIKFQKSIPRAILKNGFFSKALMSASFLAAG
jgi:hypothetical protein